MLRFATWKIIAILGMTLAAILTVTPSLMSLSTYQALAERLPAWAKPPTIVLGLDLQGGSYVMLEVDKASVLHTQVMNLRDDVRRILREEKVAITGGIGAQTRGVQLRVPDAADRAKILPKLRNLAAGFSNRMGGGASPLDVEDSGDGLIRVTVTDAGLTDKVRHAVDQSIEVIRRRVDALGTREPSIQRQGDDRIIVQVPGLQDPEQLKTILGQTAKLEFRLVAEPGQNPSEVEELDQTDGNGKIAIEKQVMVQGEDLTDAQPGFDQQRSGEPVVNFRFNIRGAQKFGEVTSKNVGRLFAIVLDNKVISAPRILTPITGGSGQISGHFTVEQANNLSILLRAGALPAKLNIVEERTVGPGLGQELDRLRKARRLCRRGPRSRLYADHLRRVRRIRQSRIVRAHRFHLRGSRAARLNPHAARHRRNRPDDRHGGQLERADLRAHSRRTACRPLDPRLARRRLQSRLRDDRRLQRHDVCGGRDSYTSWAPARFAALRCLWRLAF